MAKEDIDPYGEENWEEQSNYVELSLDDIKKISQKSKEKGKILPFSDFQTDWKKPSKPIDKDVLEDDEDMNEEDGWWQQTISASIDDCLDGIRFEEKADFIERIRKFVNKYLDEK